jgi:hypothetical protein
MRLLLILAKGEPERVEPLVAVQGRAAVHKTFDPQRCWRGVRLIHTRLDAALANWLSKKASP